MATEPRIVDVSNTDSINTPPAEPLAIPSLETLLSWEKKKLAAECRRLACALGEAAFMTEEEIDAAHFRQLAAKGCNGDIKAIRERFDRRVGKPVQAVTQDVTLNGAVAHIHADLSADLLKDQISRILKKRDNKLIDG